MQKIQKSSPRLAATGALCAAALLVPSAAAEASASVPPELQALIAKMKLLQVSSERFSASVTLHAHKVPKDLEALRALKVNLSGEANLASPQSGIVTTTVLGKPLTFRVIGKTVYTDEPALGRKDGGRPWVKETRKVQPSVTDDSPGVAGSGTAPYAAQATLIEGAKAIKALGPATVDGQPVSRFLLTVDPAKIPGTNLGGKLRAKLRRDHIVPKAQIEYDLTSEGLPIHTAGAIALGKKIRVDFTADVSAIDFPLTVAAPPAGETITTAELLTLIKKEIKKKKK